MLLWFLENGWKAATVYHLAHNSPYALPIEPQTSAPVKGIPKILLDIVLITEKPILVGSLSMSPRYVVPNLPSPAELLLEKKSYLLSENSDSTSNETLVYIVANKE